MESLFFVWNVLKVWSKPFQDMDTVVRPMIINKEKNNNFYSVLHKRTLLWCVSISRDSCIIVSLFLAQFWFCLHGFSVVIAVAKRWCYEVWSWEITACNSVCLLSLDKTCVLYEVSLGSLFYFFLFVRRLKGKELEGMSFSDLISLENQLNDSLHSVKDQKVKRAYNNLYSKRNLSLNHLWLYKTSVLFQTQILLNQVERSRLKVIITNKRKRPK